MAALTPGCRNGAGPVLGLHTLPLDPAPLPVIPLGMRGPANIAGLKQEAVNLQRALEGIQQHILTVEQALDALDPAAVVSVSVPFYADPPERVTAATAARAALEPQEAPNVPQQ